MKSLRRFLYLAEVRTTVDTLAPVVPVTIKDGQLVWPLANSQHEQWMPGKIQSEAVIRMEILRGDDGLLLAEPRHSALP